jgi:aspartate/methionine/tyrosine aminotransferase
MISPEVQEASLAKLVQEQTRLHVGMASSDAAALSLAHALQAQGHTVSWLTPPRAAAPGASEPLDVVVLSETLAGRAALAGCSGEPLLVDVSSSPASDKHGLLGAAPPGSALLCGRLLSLPRGAPASLSGAPFLYDCVGTSAGAPPVAALVEAVARAGGRPVAVPCADQDAIAGCCPAPGVGLTARIRSVSASKTGAMHALATRLRREGLDVLSSLAIGEPDFAPPAPVLDAAAQALREHDTRYTPVAGSLTLREAIAADQLGRKRVSYDPGQEVLVTHGGKQAIYQLMQVLCEHGDEVLIPTPCWVSYIEIARLSGARPVLVHRSPGRGYKLTPSQLAESITPRTRLLVLCNPCNPTGVVYTVAEQEALAAVLRRPEHQHVLVLSDEIYERIVDADCPHASFASLPGMRERTFLVSGFSKAWAMTGFRLGFLCGPAAVVRAAHTLQSHINSCPNTVAQRAGVAALQMPAALLQPHIARLNQKRHHVSAALDALPGVRCVRGRGAFYAFPDVSAYIGPGVSSASGRTIDSSSALSQHLIESSGLTLVPGDAFSAPGGLRLSCAAPMADLQDALQRLRAGLGALRGIEG